MRNYQRFNAYRVMWVFVFFDLPTGTKKERKMASSFRKKLLNDGFTMFQFSVYLRHCSSRENAMVHCKRTRINLPKKGKITILSITDKQFEAMELFHGQLPSEVTIESQQLELF